MRAQGQKKPEEGRQTPPPPSLYRVKFTTVPLRLNGHKDPENSIISITTIIRECDNVIEVKLSSRKIYPLTYRQILCLFSLILDLTVGSNHTCCKPQPLSRYLQI